MSSDGQALRPQPREGLMNIPLYIPGKAEIDGAAPIHKLSSNETPLGASAKAVDAYRQLAGNLELYPDGGSALLREAIGEVHGLHPDRILCGAGSDEILSLLSYAFMERGDEAIYSEHGFSYYPIVIMAAGATPVVARESNLTTDVDAILAAVTERTKMVFIANPNNPTGTYLPSSEIRRLHAGLPGNVILVLDAAYAEYVTRSDYETGIELAATSENVVMTRTFSKIYGLANLRLGWCYAPTAILEALYRLKEPFNVTGATQAAGVAAIRDQDFVRAAVAHNTEWLPKVSEALEALGLRVTPSVGNFILIHFLDEPGKSAAEADAYLLKRGCVLRQVGAYGLPNALRMTIGSAEACETVVGHLAKFLKGEA
ncbi:histidinol-phosphate transaminase [uncultured Cohaesibacter sp.]|uniref:pyridoxal phosphate-dependent aminotransferase n=1 Tax=uncultured Cohaesibacter sp. TaxID=1002546 RepID=UPI002931C4B5|nr:histidinol-phosphate transaminase [uncultured Cohaesibacter sp.]